MVDKLSETLADLIRELAHQENLERELHRRLTYGDMVTLTRLLNRVASDEAPKGAA